MRKHIAIRLLALIAVLTLAAALAVTGCKKKMPKEAAPPPAPPKVEEVKPAPAADTTGQSVREEQTLMDADKARIQTVYFDYDKSEIRPDQRDKITTNAEIFRKWTTWQVAIEGHCDERGTAEYNLALGERRATAAKNAIVAAGLETARVTTISYGKERPADPGHTEGAWSRNRRAEFKLK